MKGQYHKNQQEEERLEMRTLFFCLILCQFLGACKKEGTNESTTASSCKGEYSISDSNGLVRQRFNEFQSSLGCMTDPVPLTQWEKSTNKRFDTKIKCTPQTGLLTSWLKTNGNYYSYRDSKIFVELNSSSGEARRLIIGEMPDGSPSFQRQVFCYYLRTDIETEPVNPQNYGAMLLFDLELSSSSNLVIPMEIYNYQTAGNDIYLTKMDTNTVDWTFCPADSTPWGFCDALRNGNEMFFPEDPSAAVQAQLRAEAILIRSEFNFSKISKSEFEAVWNSAVVTATEVGTSKFIDLGGLWKYTVSPYFDEPLYVGREWRKYLRRERPSMPDVASASSMQVPYVCYDAVKRVTYSDGSTGLITGEACHNNGVYSFTPN